MRLWDRVRQTVLKDRELSPDVRSALVATLFASPLSLFIGGLTGTLIAFVTAQATRDPWIEIVAYSLPVIAIARLGHCLCATGLRTGTSRSAELFYELGAWAYASAVGTIAFLTLLRTADPQIHLLTTCLAVGYAAGICARNAARPFIAVGQLALSAMPMAVALLLSDSTTHLILGFVILLFVAGMISVTAQTYFAISSALSSAVRNAASARETLDSIPQMVWAHTADGAEQYYNQQWDEFTGQDLRAGRITRIELVHPDDRARVASAWLGSRNSGDDYQAEYRILHSSGDYRWVLSRGRAVRDARGKIIRWYGSCTDIDDRMLALQALNDSEASNRGIIEASPDAVSLLDMKGRVLFVNRAATEAFGSSDGALLVGARWGAKFIDSPLHEREIAIEEARRGGVGRISTSVLAPDGGKRWFDTLLAPVRDASGRPTKIVVTSRDVTRQRKVEDEVRWRAAHDFLTGLPNRASLQSQLSHRVTRPASSSAFALLLLDVDNFKQVNDTQGHDAGDALLRIVGDRLMATLRPDDFVARLGGDEFALVLSGVASMDDVMARTNIISAELKKPWTHNGRTADCRVSIGASIFPQHGNKASELLKNADIALYTAKVGNGGKAAVFQANMRAEIQKQYSMISLARTAVQDERIVPFYQPKVDLKSGRVDGFEALLRWSDRKGGIHDAETISAAFEDYSLAASLSDRMIDLVLSDVVRWRDAELPFGHVAINVAAAELRRGDFAERLLERLAAASVSAASIQVEVTESVFVGRGADYVERALNLLSTNGVAIALDDFGTGFASLIHLKQFPVDIIKIDRSFIRDLSTDADDTAIVQAVIGLGQSLGMKVVAEGVETMRQQRLLNEFGCPLGQGFLYGKGMSARLTEEMLKAKQGHTELAA